MRIKDTQSATQVAGVRKTARAGNNGAQFMITSQPELEGLLPGRSTGVVQNVSLSGLIALQSVGGDGQRKQALAHGYSILDVLEDLRIRLLSGDIPLAELSKLQTHLDEMETSGDEELDSVLQNIKLRARVELAKYNRT